MLPDALTAIALGALLGLRHATDADHVVAVTAIVARERKLSRAAWVGALWGIGHTLTLLVVGGAIVAFRLVIPPRVGLGLEFGVALMLILLGYANLRARNDVPTERPTVRPFLVLIGLFGAVIIGESIGSSVGAWLGSGLRKSVFSGVDRLGGGLIAGVQALLVLWLAGGLFAIGPMPRSRSVKIHRTP